MSWYGKPIKPTPVDISLIPFRPVSDEDAQVLAVDKTKNINRSILPLIVGCITAAATLLTPIVSIAIDAELFFMFGMIGVNLFLAISCFMIFYKRIARPRGICEAEVVNKRQDEHFVSDRDGADTRYYLLTLSIPSGQVKFETFVEAIDYSNAVVGGKAYIIKNGRKSYRVTVLPPDEEC